jgi:hypothetical protein
VLGTAPVTRPFDEYIYIWVGGLNDYPSLVLFFTLLVVLTSSKSGDQKCYEIVTLRRPPTHQVWGQARAAGNRSARDDKELGPSWRGNYLENGLVKPPRLDTRALNPAGTFGGKAPLRLAAHVSRLYA